MLLFNEFTENCTADHRVSLTFHERIKGRLRITTDGGADAGIQIDRGQVLADGQQLNDELGAVLEVVAKLELVSVASADSNLLFARACYHVGNRHAEVQIGDNQLIYLHDHVMDEMLTILGLNVTSEQLAFHPEKGAYEKGDAHSHSHAEVQAHHHDH
ncbi:MAG: urease accessory protein [Halioglobus sp.]|jgi:urease accessory protein